jgi:predicted HNH restriction endonuclease
MSVYHFHHRDPSKKNRSLSECDTVEELRREAALCDLLCSNCHSIVHWMERRSVNNKTFSFNDLGLHIPRNRF